jgi:hypothetical protein
MKCQILRETGFDNVAHANLTLAAATVPYERAPAASSAGGLSGKKYGPKAQKLTGNEGLGSFVCTHRCATGSEMSITGGTAIESEIGLRRACLVRLLQGLRCCKVVTLRGNPTRRIPCWKGLGHVCCSQPRFHEDAFLISSGRQFFWMRFSEAGSVNFQLPRKEGSERQRAQVF